MERHWKEIYDSRRTTAEEAVKVIRSGQRILVSSGCASPQHLLRAFVRRHGEIHDIELVHLLTFGVAPYVDKSYEESFRHNAFFIGPNVREAVREGRADYTPVFLSEIPELLKSEQMRLDVAMVMVSKPNRFGYVSLGIHPDIVMAGVETAKIVIAQVNASMPHVHGDTYIHVSQIHHFVEHDEALLELIAPPIDEVSIAIARHVNTLIEDGATLQLGIGNIPNAVAAQLHDRRDLGLHTEMFTDGVIDLCEQGVITNRKKGFLNGKAVASFAMGTRRLYEYIDDNPYFEFHRTEFVNDPRVIAQNDKMTSINAALQIDITGQVCADSIGSSFYSGIGGQVDFIRGAAMSKGGKPIIALPATAKDGTISRIVASLDSGAGVVTSRGDVHYVVTEYGVAYLHGKTIRERAMALIEIAHPGVRSELRQAAVARRYVPMAWQLPTEASRYPLEMEEVVDFKGRKLFVRPLRSVDADRLMEFFYSHSPETVHGRYQYLKKTLSQEEALQLCTLDYKRRFALGVFRTNGESHLVAVGRYTLNERTGYAETALVVGEAFRRIGIARHLLQRLQEHAARQNVRGFTGVFERTNVAPIQMHRSLGHTLTFEDGEARYILPFDAARERDPLELRVPSEAEKVHGGA